MSERPSYLGVGRAAGREATSTEMMAHSAAPGWSPAVVLPRSISGAVPRTVFVDKLLEELSEGIFARCTGIDGSGSVDAARRADDPKV
jgi:hypothetical protein